MNIGIDMRMNGTRNGGIGRYVKELTSRVVRIGKEHKFTLFCRPENSEGLMELSQFSNVEMKLSDYGHYSWGEQIGFWRLLESTKLDLVHFPNFNLPVFFKKPFVVTIHDAVHHKIGGAKKSHLLHFMAYKKTIEHAVNASKKIITVSEYSKNDISKTFGLNESKIDVVYEAASLDMETSTREAELIKSKLGLKRPYFLFVGVLERKKNLLTLSKGFDEFIKKYRFDFDLVIAGPPDRHYPDIKEKMLTIKNRDRLLFTGYLSENDLAALYKGAFAFVTPSLHEGFGLPGVEAMSFGLPILASNIKVFNEVYDNSAIYFEPMDPFDIAEKMHLVVRDSKFYESLSANSRLLSGFYSWEKAAEKTLQVYASAI